MADDPVAAGNGVLAVDALSLRFGGLQVLSDVELTIDANELVALVGPNGAGKSSLLNCIGGLYHPSSGSISVLGQDISKWPAHRRVHAGLARAFQHVELMDTLDVMENVLLGRSFLMRRGVLAGMTFFGAAAREEIAHRRRVEEILEFFELERYRHSPVGSLSYGIQKLVGVARAFAAEPKLLLLDEPSSGMNREEKEHLARYMLRAKHEIGATTLWIEHDMEMVMDLADRVVVLEQGRVIASGAPDVVAANQQVAEAFLGTDVN